MIFIHPIWDTEHQRLGLKTCTPMGYLLHEIADGTGFTGLALFVGSSIFLIYRTIAHHFAWHLCWLLLISIAIGIIGRALHELSWLVAAKKQFHYDYKSDTANWIEQGQTRSYPSIQSASDH